MRAHSKKLWLTPALDVVPMAGTATKTKGLHESDASCTALIVANPNCS